MIYLNLLKMFWKEILLVILSLTIFIMVLSHRNEVLELKSTIATKELENSKLDSSVTSLKLSLDRQTLATTEISVDYNNSIAELNAWKDKPAKTKYITIPATIREVKSNECNDTKSAINIIRTIDYSLL